jgi:hypothetical protein
MTLGELLSIREGLTKMYSHDIPMDEAQEAGRTLDHIEKEIAIYETNNKKLFDKYGTQEGEQIIIKPENIEGFNKERQVLLSCLVEIDIATVKASSLSDLKLSVIDRRGLDKFIESDKEPEIIPPLESSDLK